MLEVLGEFDWNPKWPLYYKWWSERIKIFGKYDSIPKR